MLIPSILFVRNVMWVAPHASVVKLMIVYRAQLKAPFDASLSQLQQQINMLIV